MRLLLVVVLASVTRLVGYTYPPRTVVDEAWYARDGCYYWTGDLEKCRLAGLVAPDRDVTTMLANFGELTPEHPPLAKWLIGAPMVVLPYAPGAWRLTAVAAGVLTVVLLYLLAKQAFRSRLVATGAAGLLAIDFLHLVHSRVAMLDLFIGLFATAAFYFCLLDKDQIDKRVLGLRSHSRWRLAAGLVAGAAAACKLSGWAVVIAAFVLVAAWEFCAFRRARSTSSIWRPITSVLVLLAIVPCLAYMATYLGRVQGDFLALPWNDGSWFRAWMDRQVYMAQFHGERPPAATSWLSMPMTASALSYSLENTPYGVRQILLFGNPVLWWAGFVAVGVAFVRLLGRHGTVADGVVVAGFVATYAGWFSLAAAHRLVYLFYAIPVAPFLYLALAAAAVGVATSRIGRIAILAMFYQPILTGSPAGSAAVAAAKLHCACPVVVTR